MLAQIGFALILAIFTYLHLNAHAGERPFLIFAILISAALLYKLPKTLAVIKVLFRHLPVDGSLKRVAIALAEALSETGFIETSHRVMKVGVVKSTEGQFHAYLKGCTFHESSLFADCLTEILAPIDNPRYLVVREGQFLGSRRDDYHAVPMKLGANKEFAQIFYRSWSKNVSASELIYTRTPEGRKRLLKAKMRAFSSNFDNEVKRQDRWQ